MKSDVRGEREYGERVDCLSVLFAVLSCWFSCSPTFLLLLTFFIMSCFVFSYVFKNRPIKVCLFFLQYCYIGFLVRQPMLLLSSFLSCLGLFSVVFQELLPALDATTNYWLLDWSIFCYHPTLPTKLYLSPMYACLLYVIWNCHMHWWGNYKGEPGFSPTLQIL